MSNDIVIVTRHPAVVEWLSSRGITGRVVSHASIADVMGKEVYGVLPLRLAAAAKIVHTIDMDVPADMRGKELTIEDMDRYGARINSYITVCMSAWE